MTLLISSPLNCNESNNYLAQKHCNTNPEPIRTVFHSSSPTIPENPRSDIGFKNSYHTYTPAPECSRPFLSRPFSENAIATPSEICSCPLRCPPRQMTTRIQAASLVAMPAVWYVPAISSRPRHSLVPPIQKRLLLETN